MKKVFSVWSMVIIMTMCVGLSSCGGGNSSSGGGGSSSKSSEYVGIWQWENDGTHKLQLFNDGTVEYNNGGYGLSRGTWKLKSQSESDRTFEWAEITGSYFGTYLLESKGNIYLYMSGVSPIETLKNAAGSRRSVSKIK